MEDFESCLSVRPYGTTRLPRAGLASIWTLGCFTKIWRTVSI